jgi:hypothetical protein
MKMKTIALPLVSFLIVVSASFAAYGAELTRLRVGSLLSGEFV